MEYLPTFGLGTFDLGGKHKQNSSRRPCLLMGRMGEWGNTDVFQGCWACWGNV